jgi:signal transduction histidine kinase
MPNYLAEIVPEVHQLKQELREARQQQAATAEVLKERSREVTEALAQQTATSQILNVISRSPSDAQPAFEAIAENAARICYARFCAVFRFNGKLLHFAAHSGLAPEGVAAMQKTYPMAPGPGSTAARAILNAAVAHVPDIAADPEYAVAHLAKANTVRSVLAVPMLKQGRPIGAIAIARAEPGAFAERQIEILKTFADQAVIAIENVRLFQEVQTRTVELSRSLDELRNAQDRLIQTEKLASLGQLTAGIAHEIKNPLNFVNNFSSISGELLDELCGVLADAPLDKSFRAEIAELTSILKGNLDRVVHHGKRADSIVKNMLLHSREESGEHQLVEINAVVEESLNLAYHGARAEKPGFNIALERSLDPDAGEVDLYPQELTRVLLNLISNAIYATGKRKQEADGVPYEPTLSARTRNLGEAVEIRIRDNGTGIPQDVMQKMFNPFFTTKPAGEGTGLGLSLSYDIVVKQHAGTIEVETKTGEYTEFRIVLPRRAALSPEPRSRSKP